MDWQTPLALLIVSLAGLSLGRGIWRTWTGKKSAGCGSGCQRCPAGGAGSESGTLVTLQGLAPRQDAAAGAPSTGTSSPHHRR